MPLGVTAWSGLAGARLVAQSCTASPSTIKPAQTSLPANAIDGPIQLITAAERYMQNFRQAA
jgi:hypothetical protein